MVSAETPVNAEAESPGPPPPTIGRIVHYKVSENDSNGLRTNNADLLPAVVVRVWGPTCVNLKVLNDGPHDVWKTSVLQGNGPGEWNWPPRV